MGLRENIAGGAPFKPQHPSGRFVVVRYLAATISTLALGLATFCTLQAGYADRLSRLDETARARSLMPGNATYFLNDPQDRPALEHALALTPYCSSAWVNLGLAYEVAGQIPRAERFLLEAARVDATYEPRWSLANFYFRTNDREKFWVWARRAAALAFNDQTPLFQLCWRMSQDPALILSRAIPDRGPVLPQYLFFLLRQDKVAEAEQVGQRLMAQSSPEVAPLLVSYCDRLITAGRMGAAVATWNALCQRGWLPYAILDPRDGRSMTNGDFATPPRTVGFDWRLQPPAGVRAVRTVSPQAFRFSFSGSQPESCQLMSQVLPTEPSRSYRLVYNFMTSGLLTPSGLRWYVSDFATWKELSTVAVGSSENSWRQGELTFRAPASDRGVVLVLQYQRAAGTTRIEGDLWLRRLTLTFR